MRRARFNELLGWLNRFGVKNSKPTLSEHLKHLTKQDLVIRKVEGIQNVTYKANFEKFERLEKTSDLALELVKYHEKKKKDYESLPINDQIAYAHGFMILQNLYLLKLELLNIFNPENAFEYSLDYLFTIQTFGIFENWLLEKCRENPDKYEEITLKTLDNYSNKVMDAIFRGKTS